MRALRRAPRLGATVFTPPLVAPGGNGEPGVRFPAADSRLLIANYTQLRLHAETFASGEWEAVILDEGQNIKNPASATAQAARALRTTQRLVLTRDAGREPPARPAKVSGKWVADVSA